jgi:hypothetical protein
MVSPDEAINGSPKAGRQRSVVGIACEQDRPIVAEACKEGQAAVVSTSASALPDFAEGKTLVPARPNMQPAASCETYRKASGSWPNHLVRDDPVTPLQRWNLESGMQVIPVPVRKHDRGSSVIVYGQVGRGRFAVECRGHAGVKM